jgi:outer membrane protein TolC
MSLALLLALSPIVIPNHPLTIHEVEEIALKNNKNIQIVDEAVSGSSLQYSQSISSWMPQVTLESLFVALQRPQILTPLEQQTRFTVNQIQLNQPLFSPELWFGVRTRKLSWDGSKENYNIAVNSTLLDARLAFYGIVLKERSLNVQKQVLGYLRQALGDEEKKFKAGKSTSFDVNQSKLSFTQAQSQEHQLLKELKTGRHSLTLILGVDPDDESLLRVNPNNFSFAAYPDLEKKWQTLRSSARGEGRIPSSLFSEDEVLELQDLAQARRPQIRKSSIALKSAKEEERRLRATYLPTVGLFADYGYYLPENGLFFKQQYNFAGGIKLQWDIFDGLKREFRIKEMTSLRRAASLALEQEIDKTTLTIRSEVAQVEEALFACLSAEEAVDLASQAMQEAEVRLSAGTISPLQYRESVRIYAEANRSYDEAIYLALRSYLYLRYDASLDTLR